jgi:hypothetical protein
MPQLYFRSGTYFQHFFELCLFSYPSPLENNAPIPARLLLLAIAGGFEYIAASFISDIFQSVVSLATLFLWTSPSDFPQKYRDGALAFLFGLTFVLRAKPFTRGTSGRRQSVTLQNIAAYLFWNNPTLVYHCALFLWSYCTGSPIRMPAPRYFWILIAPTLEMGMVHLDATTKKKDALSFKSVVLSAVGVGTLNWAVKNVPSIMIHITLLAQNDAYLSSQRTATTSNSKCIESNADSRFLMMSRGVTQFFYDLKALLSTFEHVISYSLSWLIHAGETAFGITMDLFIRRILENRGHSLYQEGAELGEGQFRLLTILPGSDDQPIRCSLRCYSTNETQSYAAISYCWGDNNKQTNKIFVNGQLLRVTRSAFEALSTLRSFYRTTTIWIDYICIDQENERDKILQIPLMPRIYENAREVIVWLGPSKTAELATSLVNRMFLINRLHTAPRTRYSYEITIDAARALKRMLKSPWFGRVWVVQEVVRARHKVTIRYGNSSLNWERFSWFTQTIRMDASQLIMLANRIGYSGMENVIALENVSLMRRLACVKDGSLSLPFYLAHIFRSVGKFDATKANDRIYGLLGLSRLSNIYLQPDYQIPLRQLFIDVVRNTLATTSPRYQLDFLTHAGSAYHPKVAGLPSWAPDWTIEISCEPLLGTEGGAELVTSNTIRPLLDDAAALASFGKVDNMEEGPRSKQVALNHATAVRNQMVKMLYNASPVKEPHAVLLPNDILELQGYKVDRIYAVGREYPILSTTSWDTQMAILSEWAEILLQHYPHPAGSPESTQMGNMFFQLLQHDRSDIRLDYTFSFAPSPTLDVSPPQTSLTLWNGIRAKLFREHVLPEPLIDAVIELARALQRTCSDRCFGMTESGYMGLFLPGTKVDDWVCVFSGARVPFNIRLLDGDLEGEDSIFELIGPAYVQGIMEGVPVPQANQFCVEKIRLR